MNINSFYNNYGMYSPFSSSYSSIGSVQGSGGLSGLSSLYGQLGSIGSSSWGSLQGFGSIDYGAAKYMQQLKSTAGDIGKTLNDLASRSTYTKSGAVSSSTENVTVSGGGTGVKDSTIEIGQIAQGQKNEGNALKASDRSNASAYNQIEIEVGGKKRQVSFTASASDTNEQLQKKMADAINQSGLGVTASIAKDDKGNSTLSVAAKGTGEGASFSIRDVSGSAVAKTGTATATQQAQDAIYSVNGGAAQTSSTNSIKLDGGVTATLKKATDGSSVKISQGVDTSTSTGLVKDLVKNYNDLLGAAKDNGGTMLERELTSIAKTYQSSLEKVGISMKSDGSLSIDDEKLNAAAEDGSLKKIFSDNGGGSYGFAGRLDRTAERVEDNTAFYAGEKTQNSLTNNGYYANDYKIYNQLAKANLLNNANMGMIFNMMI